ncbi:MAG: universal stress protein [Chloroflexi bacterium]|nr:universal stress protein [Chloroflexota bacterium]|tara:strand:- start:10210 stop:10641 length:432 start_codon:yes stop_codon:yes gene_type:complete
MNLSSILVPVYGHASDKQVVKLACELLKPSDGRLFIIYIIEINRSLPIDAALPNEVIKGDNVLKLMESLAEKSKHQVKAELIQAREAGYAIVQEAAQRKVDGIVMNIPELKRFGKFDLGKTSTYVLNNAGCNVVLWRDEITTK